MSIKTLFCGLPMGQGRIGLKGDKENVLASICECMEEVARKNKASIIVFKDFNDSYAEDLQLLLKRGFLKSHSLPSTVMKIDFDSFEGYFKNLSSSSREGFRRKFKKIAKDNPPITMEVCGSLDEATASQVHALYLQTAQQSDVEFEMLPKDFFINVSKSLPNEASFFLWRTQDKKLIAFAFCMVKGDYFVDYYLGFDYTVAHKYNLYLVRFRGLLEWCVANKMKTYEMGQSSYEIKRRLGFKFLPLYIYTKPCNKLIAPFFRFHNKFLMFERFDPVFKEMRQEGAVFSTD
jgi:predicted N-acyltransferase